MLKPAAIMGWHADVFESKQISLFLTRMHIWGCLSTADVLYVCWEMTVWVSEKNDSFCCCINFVLYQWYDTRYAPSVVHPLPPSARSWVMVCRGVHAASSRGRQRCSGRWPDTLISISNLSHTGRLQTSAKHLWHLQTQCGHRLSLLSATPSTEVRAGIKLLLGTNINSEKLEWSEQLGAISHLFVWSHLNIVYFHALNIWNSLV